MITVALHTDAVQRGDDQSKNELVCPGYTRATRPVWPNLGPGPLVSHVSIAWDGRIVCVGEVGGGRAGVVPNGSTFTVKGLTVDDIDLLEADVAKNLRTIRVARFLAQRKPGDKVRIRYEPAPFPYDSGLPVEYTGTITACPKVDGRRRPVVRWLDVEGEHETPFREDGTSDDSRLFITGYPDAGNVDDLTRYQFIDVIRRRVEAGVLNDLTLDQLRAVYTALTKE